MLSQENLWLSFEEGPPALPILSSSVVLPFKASATSHVWIISIISSEWNRFESFI